MTVKVIEDALVGLLAGAMDEKNFYMAVMGGGAKRLVIGKYDIGKPKARRKQKDGKLTFWRHEKIGSDIAKGMAERLKLSNDEWNALKKMVFWKKKRTST